MTEIDVTQSPVSVRDRNLLMQKVQELGTTEHEEIFKILKTRDVEYSINNNGVFVNLSNISDDVFHMLNNFVTFCLDNKANLDEYDKAIIDRKFQANSSSDIPHDEVSASKKDKEKGFTNYSVFNHHVSAKVIRCDNSKFNQAKKKYAKKRSLVETTKASGSEALGNELNQEPFLIP